MPVSFPCAEVFGFLTIIHRKEHDADPVKFLKKDIFWRYLKTTSTSSLRPHIERHHLDLYLRIAKEKGWEIALPGLKSQARSQGASDALQVRQVVQFSEERFHQYLLKFIVADDQVILYFLLFFYTCYAHISSFRIKSFNVVECPEFRALLLLLRNDLNIPHRTKLHELLLQAWRAHFEVLRRDLQVRVPHLLR